MSKAKVDFSILLALDVDPNDLDRHEVRNAFLQRCLDLYVLDAPSSMEEIRRLLQTVKTITTRLSH